jgi:hypothetical protein
MNIIFRKAEKVQCNEVKRQHEILYSIQILTNLRVTISAHTTEINENKYLLLWNVTSASSCNEWTSTQSTFTDKLL